MTTPPEREFKFCVNCREGLSHIFCKGHDCEVVGEIVRKAYIQGRNAGIEESAKIADRMAGQLMQDDYQTETGGMEEVITIKNLILALKEK